MRQMTGIMPKTILLGIAIIAIFLSTSAVFFNNHAPQLVTPPHLQWNADGIIQVVWFTSFEGKDHFVELHQQDGHRVNARSRLVNSLYQENGNIVPLWRHEAHITGLSGAARIPYRVVNLDEKGSPNASEWFSLAPIPSAERPLKILLTSDHQRKLMVPANLQKAVETIGNFDAVFFAGDLIELPSGFDDWFTDPRGFFPSLHGTAKETLNGHAYTGAPILQHTPIFPAIGNHDVAGRYSAETSLRAQFNDPYPRAAAIALHPDADEQSIKRMSFNTDAYQDIFDLPPYYAVTVGDVRLIVLYATRIWRSFDQDKKTKGKFQEAKQFLDNPAQWGYGDFIFEPLDKGSEQYRWLENELNSPAYQKAKLHVVMLHNPLHSLGQNAAPPFANPVQTIHRDGSGAISGITYTYPEEQDILIRDIEPLLEKYQVDLVFNGHSHLWNRFRSKQGMHFLETSNVGNSYGAYTQIDGKRVPIPVNGHFDYASVTEPNGLQPIVPTLAPLTNAVGEALPYIASNDLTVFSVLDTGRKVIDSYYFDPQRPAEGVIKFDSFSPYR